MLEEWTLLWEEPHANQTAFSDVERDWMTRAATSRLSFFDWLRDLGLAGYFGKTYPACCRSTEDGTLVSSSGRWSNSGMGSPTEFWTLSSSESPSNAVESSLLLILEEIGPALHPYYLSPKACRGIIKRSETRGLTGYCIVSQDTGMELAAPKKATLLLRIGYGT